MAEKTVKDCISGLKDSQRADYDNRIMVREADHFLNKRDGQWEPEIISKFAGKPRYTFDECNPIVDDIMGEMESMDFDIRVNPAGGEASKDTAQAYEGIIRNIENISSSRFIYNAAGKIMVGTGFAAWRVVQEFRDGDSFQQDLLIKQVPNAQDAVWFDQGAIKQDMSDAKDAWVLTSMSRPAYEKQYPEGSGTSIGREIDQQVYSYKKSSEVIIGEYWCIRKKKQELALLSNNSVVVVDDEFESVRDDLMAKGISVVRTRERMRPVVYHRVFDGDDWLTDEATTVFSHIPVIPVYGNFRISEDKVIYWGVVEKLMDAQRVINYAESRKIEEGALSPRGKIWMTKDQAESAEVKRTLRTLNTNADPVQFYDHVEGVMPPQYQGAPASNPGLQETSQASQQFIQRTSGTYDEARGMAPAQRSGTAIDKLQQKSDNPKRKWFTAMEIALKHTCRILVQAIPKVYDTRQEMRLINPDGTTDTITIKEPVLDEATGQIVELNDLSKGQYDVICTAGPAFHSRQQETVTAINEIAAIDPTIMSLGADILLNNIASPGVDQIAERKRAMMIQQGLIPENQLTEEEKETLAQQQPQEPEMDPTDQANMMIAQTQQLEAQSRAQERMMKLQIEQQKLDLKKVEVGLKAQQAETQTMLDATKATADQIKTMAETLKTIKEAMGVDAIMTPAATSAYQGQAEDLDRAVQKQ